MNAVGTRVSRVVTYSLLLLLPVAAAHAQAPQSQTQAPEPDAAETTSTATASDATPQPTAAAAATAETSVPAAAPVPPPLAPVPVGAAQAADYESAPSAAPRRRRSFVPMVIGLGVFVGSYVFSAAVGLELYARDSTLCLNCRFGPRLMIPLAGPWLFYPKADGTDGKVLSAVLGVAQGAGLLLSIWGITKFINSAPDTAEARADRFGLALSPLPHGGYGSLRMRF